MAKNSGVKMITPKFRANWVFLFSPKKARNEGSKPKYSITMLFDKGTDLKKIKWAIQEAGALTWGADMKKWPKLGYMALKNQATAVRKNDEGEEYLPPGYENGAFFLQANTNNPPGVIGPDKSKILDENEVYSGCYCRASVVFKTYDVDGARGITCYLQNVQKMGEGEKLGGRVEAEDEFSAIETDETVEVTQPTSELDALL